MTSTKTTAQANLRIVLRLVKITVFGSLLAGLAPQWAMTTEVQRVPRPLNPVEASARQLTADHDCWTNAAPDGAIAASTVITDGSGTRWTTNRVMVDRALNVALGRTQDATLHVHSFCPVA